MKDNNKEFVRETGPDIVRCVACFFVVAAHFYLNCGYYNDYLVGTKMFIMTGCRWLFVTAVPLFFMLTGYFKLNKKVDRKHYISIVPLLVSYVVISIGKMILYNQLYGKIYTFTEGLKNLGNYQIAWYMGSYLCLFLLIPFLNKLWGALNEKEQNILILILVFLCSVYPVFNYIAPYYFMGIYPIMFYYIGAAIRVRRYRYNKLMLLVIAIAVSFVEAVISYKFTKTGLFDWTVISTTDGTYGTLFIAISAVCIFLALYDVNIKQGAIKRLLASISNVSFEIYLFAGAYDAIIYGQLKKSISGGAPQFFWWFFVTVPISFGAAYISSVVFKAIVNTIAKLISNRKNQ